MIEMRKPAKIRPFAAKILFVMAIVTLSGRAHGQSAQEPEVTHIATLTTSMGTIEIELYGKDAPKTVKNFVELIGKGFYDGLLVHKVIPGFLVQMGDPKTRDMSLRREWGSGGQSIYGGYFPDELNPLTPSYRRGYVKGTVAMANRYPMVNTNTSQFFIMLTDNDSLPTPIKPNYTIFGRVINGMSVVEAIGRAELLDGAPKVPVRILNAAVIGVTPAR